MINQIGGSSSVLSTLKKTAGSTKGKTAGILAKVTPFIGPALKILTILVGLFFLILALPAGPIIIYLSILFNVIKLMWERLKEL